MQLLDRLAPNRPVFLDRGYLPVKLGALIGRLASRSAFLSEFLDAANGSRDS